MDLLTPLDNYIGKPFQEVIEAAEELGEEQSKYIEPLLKFKRVHLNTEEVRAIYDKMCEEDRARIGLLAKKFVELLRLENPNPRKNKNNYNFDDALVDVAKLCMFIVQKERQCPV